MSLSDFPGEPPAKGRRMSGCRLFRWRLLLMACGLFLACNRQDGSDVKLFKSATSKSSSTQAKSRDWSENQAEVDGSPLEESWDVAFVGDSRVGHEHIRVFSAVLKGDECRNTVSDSLLHVKRNQDVVNIKMQISSLESPSGDLIECSVEQNLAVGRVHAQVDGDQLLIRATSQGKSEAHSIPWSKDIRGFFGDRQVLRQNPMKPGEERDIKLLVPPVFTVGHLHLKAEELESVSLRNLAGGPSTDAVELLRIRAELKIQNVSPTRSVLWVDAKGVIRKRVEDLFETTWYHSDQPVDPAISDGPAFDIFAATLAKIDKPLPAGHRTKFARYRLQFADGIEAIPPVQGATQQVKKIDERTYEVTVLSLRPGSNREARLAEDREVQDADRTPNAYIQSDDRRVMKLAQDAAPADVAGAKAALALEEFVHEKIEKKDYRIPFATASEVAKDLQGDCSEHAVLLTALARARKIPARAVAGLVYLESKQAFAYHMWTEVYLEDRWIPIDATLGMGGIGAGHIKLIESSLAGNDGLEKLMGFAQFLGKVTITLEESK